MARPERRINAGDADERNGPAARPERTECLADKAAEKIIMRCLIMAGKDNANDKANDNAGIKIKLVADDPETNAETTLNCNKMIMNAENGVNAINDMNAERIMRSAE